MPLPNASMSFSALSSGTISFIFSTKPLISPIPNNLLTKDVVSNASSSPMCSPVPMNKIGALVSLTAEIAPPPLA